MYKSVGGAENTLPPQPLPGAFPSPPQAFFAQIYSEAQASQAAAGHDALAEMHTMRRIKRHYTLNIDGLAEVRQIYGIG